MSFDSFYAALVVFLGGLMIVGPDQLFAGPGGHVLANLVQIAQGAGANLFAQLFSPLFGALGVLNSIPQMLQALL
jgi:hypothetical protein